MIRSAAETRGDLYQKRMREKEVLNPDSIVPFGRFRGTKYSDLPRGYMIFLLTKVDGLRSDIRKLLNELTGELK